MPTSEHVQFVPICSVDGSTFAGYGVRVVDGGKVVAVLGFAAASSRSLASRRARIIVKRYAPHLKVVVITGDPLPTM